MVSNFQQEIKKVRERLTEQLYSIFGTPYRKALDKEFKESIEKIELNYLPCIVWFVGDERIPDILFESIKNYEPPEKNLLNKMRDKLSYAEDLFRITCKIAIKAGDKLNIEDYRAITDIFKFYSEITRVYIDNKRLTVSSSIFGDLEYEIEKMDPENSIDLIKTFIKIYSNEKVKKLFKAYDNKQKLEKEIPKEFYISSFISNIFHYVLSNYSILTQKYGERVEEEVAQKIEEKLMNEEFVENIHKKSGTSFQLFCYKFFFEEII